MNDMGGMGDMNDTMGGMDMGMVMYFNFVMPLTVVFEQWVISDQGGKWKQSCYESLLYLICLFYILMLYC